MIHQETAETYHGRKAVSAGFLWDMVSPDGCPRQAWYDSVFNPNPPPAETARELDIGKAAHLAILEPDELMSRICLIDAANYRTKAAQETRADAYEDGFTPLLAHEYQLVLDMRKAIEASDAAELLLGEGQSEVSYTWEADGIPGTGRTLLCKARADRITPAAIVDLKTAASASPAAFQNAMLRDGHHLRAAWYLDGFMQQSWQIQSGQAGLPDYLYVVVAKAPPHLVEVYRLDEQSLEWGRRLYRKGLQLFRECQETGVWPGYGKKGENVITSSLPAFVEYRYGDMEDQGEI